MSPDPRQLHIDELQSENAQLRDRLEQLLRLDLEATLGGLSDIVAVARRHLPPQHHEATALLLRLAYFRGKVDAMETAAVPLRVVLCSTCTEGQ